MSVLRHVKRWVSLLIAVIIVLTSMQAGLGTLVAYAASSEPSTDNGQTDPDAGVYTQHIYDTDYYSEHADGDEDFSAAHSDVWLAAVRTRKAAPSLQTVDAQLSDYGVEDEDLVEAYVFDAVPDNAKAKLSFRGLEKAHVYGLDEKGNVMTDLGWVDLTDDDETNDCIKTEPEDCFGYAVTVPAGAAVEQTFKAEGIAVTGAMPMGTAVAIEPATSTDKAHSFGAVEISMQDKKHAETQPADAVTVEITDETLKANIIDAIKAGKEVCVNHIHDDGTKERVDLTITGSDAAGYTVTFVTDSFSVFDTIWADVTGLWERVLGFADHVITTVIDSADVTVTLSGTMPTTAEVTAVEEENSNALYDFDFTLTAQNVTIQPQSGKPIEVAITGDEILNAVKAGKSIAVYHGDEAVAVKTVSGDTVTFEAAHFSEYSVVAEDNYTTDLLTVNEQITISGTLPEHLSATAEAVTVQDALFAADITLSNYDVNDVQPADGWSPVTVAVTDPEFANAPSLYIYHKIAGGPWELVAGEKKADKNGTVTFTADSFSVYAIFDHEDGNLVTPHVVFHYIDYNYTESGGVYTAGPYNFPTASSQHDYFATQILKNGETLTHVVTPPDRSNQHFEGWYAVSMQSDTTHFSSTAVHVDDNTYGGYTGSITYIWQNNPTRIRFDQSISVTASGSTVTWTMDGVSHTDTADEDGAVHVYLAPLYVNYHFVDFFDYDGNMIARKLLVLDSNNMATMLVSDLEATNPNSDLYFMGWSSVRYPLDPNATNPQNSSNTISLYENGYIRQTYITFFDENTNVDDPQIDCYVGQYTDPAELSSATEHYVFEYNQAIGGYSDIHMYAEFEAAHWLRFVAGETGWGALYVPADYLVGNQPATVLPVTERPGYVFAGWYTGYQDAAGHIHYGEQVSSGMQANAAGSTSQVVSPASPIDLILQNNSGAYTATVEGVTINVDHTGVVDTNGELSTTADSNLYAKWTAEGTASYKITLWRQKASDEVNYTDAEKNYDFVESSTHTAESLSVLRIQDEASLQSYLTKAGTTGYVGFHFGRCDTAVLIDPQGTSVVNVYYDRDVHTYTFKRNNYGATFTLTTADTGTQYAFINGRYETLTYSNGEWMGPTYGYNYTANNSGTFVRLTDGTYAELRAVNTTSQQQVFVNTTTLTAGEDYLILNTTTAGNGYALGHNGTSIARDLVTVNAGIAATGNAVYINAADVDATSIWTVANGYTFKNGNYYIYLNGANLAISTNSTNWTWNAANNRLYSRYNGTDYRIRYRNNTFSVSNQNNSVYLYRSASIPVETFDHYEYTDADGNTVVYTNEQRYTRSYGQTGTGPYKGPRYTRTNTTGTVYVITALYGHSIAEHFPITYAATNGTNYTNDRWNPTNSTVWKNGNVMVYIDTMTTEDVIFTYSEGTASTKTMYYYVESLSTEVPDETFNGIGYTLYRTVPAKYNFISHEDCSAIYGCTYVTSNNSTFNASDDATTTSTTIKFYYSRNKHTLTFAANYPGAVTFHESGSRSPNFDWHNIAYGEPISTYHDRTPEPNAPDHYVFDGWYKDASCTVPFDFAKETMPDGNKIVYAKWYPIYYRIYVDPNGGTLGGPNATNQSTYFWLQYGQAIGRYAINRDYLQDPAGTYYYRSVSPTINANGTVDEHAKWDPYPNVSLWSSDLDADKDAEGIRPSSNRLAEYIEISKYHTNDDAFYQALLAGFINSGMTAAQAAAAANGWDSRYVDTTVTYRPITDGDPTWSLVGWYQVDSAGKLTPFDFSTAVTENITLRAEWRQSGQYYLHYDCNMTQAVGGTQVSGIPTYSNPYDPTTPTGNDGDGYADKAYTHATTAPKSIKGGSGDSNVYVFEGWRVIYYNPDDATDPDNGKPLDANGNILTTGTGTLYQPGDDIQIRSEQAAKNVIYLEAYYNRIEDSARYPKVVQLTLDANDAYNGYVDPNSAEWPVWASAGKCAVNNHSELTTVNGDDYPTQILFGDAQINQPIHLNNYKYFFRHTSNYFLIGYDEQSNPNAIVDTNGNPNQYIPAIPTDAVVGIDDPTANNLLYACWEPMVYVTFHNTTGAPVTIDLTGSAPESVEIINNVIQLYERSKVTDMTNIVVPAASTVKIVMPNGAGKNFMFTTTNNHAGYMMGLRKQIANNPEQTIIDCEDSATAIGYGGTHGETGQTLIENSTGIIYTFTEKTLPYSWFDPNGGTWNAGYRTNEFGTGSIYYRQGTAPNYVYRVSIQDFPSTAPTNPTPPTVADKNLQFIGWTIDPIIAGITDFSLTSESLISDMTMDPDVKAHLQQVIANYKEANGLTDEQVTNLYEVVKGYCLWNFNDAAGGLTLYAVYAETARVYYHLGVRNTNNNHTWGGARVGETYTQTTTDPNTGGNTDWMDGRQHTIYYREVVKGDAIIRPLDPSWYAGNSAYQFLYWIDKSQISTWGSGTQTYYTAGDTLPNGVTPFDFSAPLTEEQHLYTSWTQHKSDTVHITKQVDGTLVDTSEVFRLNYTVKTYQYIDNGTEYPDRVERPTLEFTSATNITHGNEATVNLFYWTENGTNETWPDGTTKDGFYEQCLFITEANYAQEGYLLTIGNTSTYDNLGRVNPTNSGEYQYYPFYNEDGNSLTERMQVKRAGQSNAVGSGYSTVWKFTRLPGNTDHFFYQNNWYNTSNITGSTAIGTTPALDTYATFTNTRHAEARIVKVGDNGISRLNGATYTIERLNGNTDNAVADTQMYLYSTNVATESEGAGNGMDGRACPVAGQNSTTTVGGATYPSSNDGSIYYYPARNVLVFTQTGRYRLTETKAPNGYQTPAAGSNAVIITVSASGISAQNEGSADILQICESLNIWNTLDSVEQPNEYAVVIKNTALKTNVVLENVNINGDPISSTLTRFSLTGYAEQTVAWNDFGELPTTGGYTATQAMPYGTFTATQTAKPGDEYAQADPTTITITADGLGNTVVTATGNSVYTTTVGGIPYTAIWDDDYVSPTEGAWIIKILNEQSGYHLTLDKTVENGQADPNGYNVTVQAASAILADVAGKTFNVVTTRKPIENNTPTNSTVVFDASGAATINIMDGYVVQLRSLPQGQYTVSEAAGGTDYKTDITVSVPATNTTLVSVNNNANPTTPASATFTLSANTTAAITNTISSGVAPTQYADNSRPFLTILTIGLVLLLLFGILTREKHRNLRLFPITDGPQAAVPDESPPVQGDKPVARSGTSHRSPPVSKGRPRHREPDLTNTCFSGTPPDTLRQRAGPDPPASTKRAGSGPGRITRVSGKLTFRKRMTLLTEIIQAREGASQSSPLPEQASGPPRYPPRVEKEGRLRL